MATFYSATAANVVMALRITETATNTNENTSAISWALLGWYVGPASGSGWYSNRYHDISVVINGTSVFSRGSNVDALISIGTNHPNEANALTIASGTMSILHDSDGTKTLSAAFSCAYKWVASAAWAASGTMALTQIARASQPSCITWPSTTQNIGYLGDTIYVHTNRASEAFTHTLRYAWGNKTGTIATDVGNNAQWTIPLDFANNIPKQSTGWGTIYCDTYYGSTLIGTKSVGFSVSVPNTLAPTVSASLTRPRTTASAVTGYIQNIDSLKVIITATGKYGATITGYSSTVNGTAYAGSTFATGILSKAGTIKVAVTVTDSRGKQTTINREITVTSYSPPVVTGMSAYRCKGSTDATADAGGGYICITPKGTITSLSNTNAKKCIVYWKKVSDSAWQSKELAMSAYTLSGYIIVSADTASSYNIYARLQDSFKTIDHYGSDVMSATAFIDILMASSTDITKKGLGIGKTAEKEGTLDLGWDLILRRGVSWPGMQITYFTPATNVNGDYYGKYGSYVKLGHIAFVTLMIQIKTISGTVPEEIKITLPDALKAIDHWLQPSYPILNQWEGSFLGSFKQNQNSTVLTVYPAKTVTGGTYFANGCYTLLVQ